MYQWTLGMFALLVIVDHCCECGYRNIWESLCCAFFVYTWKWGCKSRAYSMFASPVSTWFHAPSCFCNSPKGKHSSLLWLKKGFAQSKTVNWSACPKGLGHGGFPDLGCGSLLDCSPVRAAPTCTSLPRLCPSIVVAGLLPAPILTCPDPCPSLTTEQSRGCVRGCGGRKPLPSFRSALSPKPSGSGGSCLPLESAWGQ